MRERRERKKEGGRGGGEEGRREGGKEGRSPGKEGRREGAGKCNHVELINSIMAMPKQSDKLLIIADSDTCR